MTRVGIGPHLQELRSARKAACKVSAIETLICIVEGVWDFAALSFSELRVNRQTFWDRWHVGSI